MEREGDGSHRHLGPPVQGMAEAGARVCRNPVRPAISREKYGHVTAWLPWPVPGCDAASGLLARGEGAVPGGLGSDALARTIQG